MKIYQSAFTQDLIIEKEFNNYNVNIILIKVGSSIKILDPKDYNEADLYMYQRLVRKLIYLLCGIRPDILFVVGQLNKYNVDLRKRYF